MLHGENILIADHAETPTAMLDGEVESLSKEEYEVEAIVDFDMDDDGTPLYEIKWKDWPTSENTWEPIEHLRRSKNLVDRFHQELKEKQGRRKRSRRSNR